MMNDSRLLSLATGCGLRCAGLSLYFQLVSAKRGGPRLLKSNKLEEALQEICPKK